MVRYTGPKLRIVRRLGNLPGLTTKKSKSKYLPGQHKKSKLEKSKKKQYAVRLEEKQKLRYNYGVTERQLVSYVKQAKKAKGISWVILLELLEMRLDNIIFRLGLANTIQAARQKINHGHICINGRCMSIPSYQCRQGDLITIENENISNTLFLDSYKQYVSTKKVEKGGRRPYGERQEKPSEENRVEKREGFLPSHLAINHDLKAALITRKIEVSSSCIGFDIDGRLVIEYYYKKA